MATTTVVWEPNFPEALNYLPEHEEEIELPGERHLRVYGIVSYAGAGPQDLETGAHFGLATTVHIMDCTYWERDAPTGRDLSSLEEVTEVSGYTPEQLGDLFVAADRTAFERWAQ